MSTEPLRPGAAWRRFALPVGTLIAAGALVLLLLILSVWVRKSAGRGGGQPAKQDTAKSVAFLQHGWKSGKILAGQNALAYLLQHLDENPALFSSMETALIQAAHDADFSVRQLAFRVLERRQHPALPALAAEQLADADPQLRLLGLEYLTRVGSAKLVALIAPLLNDSDPRVAAGATTTLRQWIGANELSGPAGADGQVSDVQRWQKWWRAQAGRFAAPIGLSHPDVTPRLLQTSDFVLEDWRGQPVRLSDFKGRVVILHFFDTRITNSLSDLPALIALQERHKASVAVFGIASDTAALAERCKHAPGEKCPACERAAAGKPPVDVPRVRAQLAELVNQQQVKHSIAVDPTGEVMGRFVGSPVPAFVLIDRAGHVWRRFTGNRASRAWEAILAEAVEGGEPHRHIPAANRPDSSIGPAAARAEDPVKHSRL